MTVTAILPLPADLDQRPEAVFTPVVGVSPLSRIIEGLCPRAEVVVATAWELMPSVRSALQDRAGKAVAAQGFSPKLVAAEPAAGRAQCVAAALAEIDGDAPVLLHHVEWPVVPPTLVDRISAALAGGAAAAWPTLPVTDSVKAVDAAGTVTATVDRALLRSVQYPRGYAARTLKTLLAEDSDGTFDDLALALSAGLRPTLVEGDADAVTVELPRDSDYLSAVLQSVQNPPGR